MLLDMDHQNSAVFMSLNMTQYSMMNDSTSPPPHGGVGVAGNTATQLLSLTSQNSNGSNGLSGANAMPPPQYTGYNMTTTGGAGSLGAIAGHLNNNNNSSSINNNTANALTSHSPLPSHNNNNNTSNNNNNHHHQNQNSASGGVSLGGVLGGTQQQQQQQQHQQQQSLQQAAANNYSLYNFDSPYMFSAGGYHENISQTQSNYLAAIPPSGTHLLHSSQSQSSNHSSSNSSSSGGVGCGMDAFGLNVHNAIRQAVGGQDHRHNTDFKYFIEELCPVCGDKVSGYHYGLLTCESCKGFFKRTVQNKKVYTCVAERQCHIDKTQRKRCPYCRFQKCLEVGMKLEAVRADRMRGGRNKFGPMYKRDRARKLQIMRQRQLAIQALRGSIGGGVGIGQLGTADGTSPAAAAAAAAGLQGLDYHQSPYSSMHIKQEIQIPQVSSLTSSPDSSPSPIAIALGQVNPQTTISLSSGVGGNGSSGGGGSSGGTGGGGGTGGAGSGGAGSGGAGTNGGSNSTSAAIQSQLSESKLWMSANSTTASPHSLSPKTFSFDSGTNPTSTADNPADTLRVSPMIRDFVQSIDGDDREWTASLFSLLQNQSYNQCEVDLFELMCKVLDQNLFSQVDWARNTIFFKDLKVDDQMKLLQNSWSDMLVLDHIHQRLHNALPDETTLHNGQKFDLLGLGLLGVPALAEHFNELQNKLQELKFDVGDYICMKFLLLLNPGKGDVRGITNRKTVIEGYENVQAALLDYTLTCYPSVPDKFAKLLSIIPEIHVIASRGEEHLYIKHCAGSAPSQTLLMEMLHAKRK